MLLTLSGLLPPRDLAEVRELAAQAAQRRANPVVPEVSWLPSAVTPRPMAALLNEHFRQEADPWTEAEREMERLQGEIAALDARLADPALYDRNPAEAQSLGEKRDAIQAKLDAAEQTWLEANEAYEAAASV